MTLRSDSYGSVDGVAAYCRHATDNGAFTGVTTPTLAQVEAWIDARSAVLNGWLATAGYTVPVTASAAVIALARYANLGATADVELAQRAGGYSADSEDTREQRFERLFAAAHDWIMSGAPGDLGAGSSSTVVDASLRGLAVGNREAGGGRHTPIFTRGEDQAVD